MNKNLVDEACRVYDVKLPEFAYKFGLKKTTLQTWRDNERCSKIGEVMLNALIENKKLRAKMRSSEEFKQHLKKYLES